MMTKHDQDAMVERIASPPASAIVKIAKDESIDLGFVGGSRRSMARAIVSERARRVMEREAAITEGKASKWYGFTNAFYGNERRYKTKEARF